LAVRDVRGDGAHLDGDHSLLRSAARIAAPVSAASRAANARFASLRAQRRFSGVSASDAPQPSQTSVRPSEIEPVRRQAPVQSASAWSSRVTLRLRADLFLVAADGTT